MSNFELSIGDFVARTGVSEQTLRMWERRYGFPHPARTASGHRRYSEDQATVVDRVLALRDAGLSLPAAIVRAQALPDPEAISLFASLRSQRPGFEVGALRKPLLIALSHAIENETLARAEARVLFACFQRERFYRQSQARWRELSAAASVAAVFADFKEPPARRADGAGTGPPEPAEVPISRRQQLAREWAIVAYGGRSSICMVARELASSRVSAATAERTFELAWTVDPEAVRAVGRGCVALLRTSLPRLAAVAESQLAIDAPAPPAEQARLTKDVMNRLLGAL